MKKQHCLLLHYSVLHSLNAHNVWLEPAKDAKGQYVVKFGHEETETYPQSKLKAVRLLDAKGQLQNAEVTFKQGEAYFAAPETAIAFIRFDNGVWSKLPSGKYVEKTNNRYLSCAQC